MHRGLGQLGRLDLRWETVAGYLSVKLRAVLNMLTPAGGWRQSPWGVPHCHPPCSRMGGSSGSGMHRDAPLSFPGARVDDGGREGGRRAACSLPSAPPQHTAQPGHPFSPGAVRGQEGQGHPHSWQ